MRSEPLWVPVEALIRFNQRLVAETGEPHAVLSQALLESAWGRPIAQWSYGGQDDPVALAVALMAGVARNHPFQQGNKRTAFAAGVAFLNLNGRRLTPDFDSDDLADAFVSLLEHQLDEAGFAAMLAPHVVAD